MSNPLARAYLLMVSFLFFGWCWTHGGQTLGMRAWKIRLVNFDGKTVSWSQALTRFCLALLSWLPFGLGFIWSLFEPQRMAWHDRYSKSRLIVWKPR